MTIRLLSLFVLMASVPAASAQGPAPPESVTVTAAKSRATVEKFAKAFTMPTKLAGKIARWESGICPVTVGQPPALSSLVTDRVKDIAASVGAPISSLQPCMPNIQIVFTTTPQALLDDVRAHDPDYLGYAETGSQREKLATVTRPAQAWYSTETIDMSGGRKVDSARQVGAGITMKNIGAAAMPFSMGVNRDPIYLPNASYAKVTGNHINSAVRSGFNHVLIVVDSSKLAGRKFNPLADYIAMLALTQLSSPDACQELPSIVNMLAADCDQAMDGMTVTDLTYLRALYKMDADKNLVSQQNEIADRMQQALAH
ncbi:MAG TPA: hypothetical protein VFA87_08235 [Rhizomicrobium sp.]|nr:hypothetical protein [Rhizomicrobium sp.]